ncbi:MAG TPA: Amuc_1098 family type IV pilus outer membrane protein [Chthoniobacteraceae bacterium]|jgi:general secretion pathway protein D|nr:Amuc_1098 family type IV pilus outer membrane protein [Chthoniobacteraceae bacterium]
MRIKPPAICACVIAAAAAAPVTLFAGGPTTNAPAYAYAGNTETVADRAIARKEEHARRAQSEIEAGDIAMKQRDYETAFAQYKAACDDIYPASPATQRIWKEAAGGLCDAACALAEQRISEGRYEDAKNLCNAVLDPKYDPNCHRATVILAHLEDPDYYNRTITPQFRGKVEETKRLFTEAQGYMDSGQFDKAFRDYEKVLNLDPYNIAARKGEDEVNARRDQYATEAYNNTRGELLWQLDQGWEMPVHKFGVKTSDIFTPQQTDVRHTEYITSKLNRIIIPKIDFKDASIREAVNFLKQKSVELDTQEPDPNRRGINIVLQLEGGETAPAPETPANPAAPTAPAIPGLEPTPASPATATPAAATAPVVSSGEARITLSLSNIPLMEALKYICNLANLKMKIDPYAVSIVPPSVNTEELITKEYKVPAGFMSTAPNVGASALNAPAGGVAGGVGGVGGSAPTDVTNAGANLPNRQSAQDFLASEGVQFPTGASAVYFASSSRLIVHNTATNLELVDAIIENMQAPVPTQVSIEAKFVEIQQQNEKELSMNVLLGQFNIPGTSGRIFGAGGTVGTGTPINASDYPLSFPTTGATAEQSVTSGLRSGNYAISANAIQALLFPSAASTGVAPAIFGVGSVLTEPSFQVVLRALDQKKGIDLLSAPRVTTKSGQRAVIEVIEEFRYPTEFNPPQIPQNIGSNGGGAVTLPGEVQQPQIYPVTPTTPTAFETRNTGVTLEVEPTVGSDNYTIDLNLVPQVVEFEGFINYGSPILTLNPNAFLGTLTGGIANEPSSIVLTPNVINQPIFSTRKVTTSVTVWDGQTVVLGGLMREDVQKVQDKVPILGDIPLIGRAFRSNVDQHLKVNLVIFVTARLVNPAGDAILDTSEKDETVEPLPLPQAPVEPIPEAPLFQK